ncbi:MAG: biotin carboxylase N-terminal domain-containing protein [Burkholderiaceae bacterium]
MADVDFRPIRRLLVANRGEIARRVFRTARRMGIETVAVYSDGDANAPFVREADRAIALGGRTPGETYLDVGKVLDACRRSGADAVHPGYGFLSENAAFAQSVIDAGLVWVGPPPAAIRGLGDKLAAKRVVREVGVPTLEAFELAPGADAASAARRIGYPVLVKAAAGGGGRGMRIVTDPAELDAAIEGARREAAASFADGTVFLERWLERSRHVEIQILGDAHGNLVHLFERECSVQRRHQKIVEEAPSVALDPELRERMARAALAAARHIGYQNAGTAEFLVAGREFFFLEVNARLQVEHPVTEAITGLDLVREQLRVAQGEPLGFSQSELRIDGHAIEVRVCAEDPAQGFLPTPGTVEVWAPPTDDDVRVDAGIESGSEIGIEFDPMIAKVIVKAPTRREAAMRLARALEMTRLQGVVHNRDYLVAILRSPEFLAGDTTTDFLERVALPARRAQDPLALDHAAIGAALHARAMRRASATVLSTIPGGFRNSSMPPQRVEYRAGAVALPVEYWLRRDGGFDVSVDGRAYLAAVMRADADGIDVTVDAQRVRLAVSRAGERVLLHGADGDIELVEQPRLPDSARAQFHGGLKAPMPGRVLELMVSEGQAVTRGQPLLVLEAMKMEHRIAAPTDGTVRAVKVAVGEQVANGAALIEIDD